MALETLIQIHQPTRREISVLLTDDAHIRELNREWRSIDEATDVLSWPSPDFPGAALGDLAISLDTAEKQAVHRGDTLENEVAILGIHGGLHLLGFDDLTENQHEEMQVKMREVAEAAGIAIQSEWSSLPHNEEADAGPS